MFSKRKNHSEVLVLLESNDARKSFRVCPPLSEPIRIECHGKSIPLKNIGATGLAFPNKGFKPGESHRVSFHLPRENTPISVTAKIIDIDPDEICHCRFLGLDEDGRNAIHRYMLAVQIQEIRARKNAVAGTRPAQKTARAHKLAQEVLD